MSLIFKNPSPDTHICRRIQHSIPEYHSLYMSWILSLYLIIHWRVQSCVLLFQYDNLISGSLG